MVSTPIGIRGKAARVWIDNGSPITIFTVGELKKTLGASNMKLEAFAGDYNELRDYGNHALKLVGMRQLLLESNGWKVNARIKGIGGNRLSTFERDLMANLGL